MKIAFITNLRAPYRTLQLNEFSRIKNLSLTVFYTDKPKENRVWEVNKPVGYREVDLIGIKILRRFGYINKGLVDIVKTHDILILGGYEKPTYIALSLLCKQYKKPYILLFDGISANRLQERESLYKWYIKNLVVKNAEYIMGNGQVSSKYFSEVFSYPETKIYNQYLTVDTEKIKKLYKDKEYYRTHLRDQLGIRPNEKVLLYSGRLIDIKNVETVIRAISTIKTESISFLIVGGGKLEADLKKIAEELNVKVIITGFLSNQEDVFKHYFVGDVLILPSIVEPWGLVVNEALAAGMPVIVSKYCGCVYDLVHHNQNGYIVDPLNIKEIAKYIENIMFLNNRSTFSKKSREIANAWTFQNSRKSLEHIIGNLNNK